MKNEIMDDGTPYPFLHGPVDNGYKLPINSNQISVKTDIMAQQTAVEWLEIQVRNFNDRKQTHYEYDQMFIQAKAMEKEQIKDAFKVGYGSGFDDAKCDHINDCSNSLNDYIYLKYEKNI